VYYLLIPTVFYIENTMIVQGDTVMYKVANFKHSKSEGEDVDYTNDVNVLNN
jgi:hypothetical protein